MTADVTYITKIQQRNGGDMLAVASGGSINVETGGQILLNGALSTALTAQLTTITPADAAGTPDYVIAAVTQTTPFGFSNAAEAITILYVIQNLQVRVAQLESRLQALGVVA